MTARKENRLKIDILFTEDAIQCQKFERCISNTIMSLLYYANDLFYFMATSDWAYVIYVMYLAITYNYYKIINVE